jgi:hypothetical protein
MDKLEKVKVRKKPVTRKGLSNVRRGKKPRTVPQDVLNKYLPKPSDDEIDSIWTAINDTSIWEKTPGVYAQAVGVYMFNSRQKPHANVE